MFLVLIDELSNDASIDGESTVVAKRSNPSGKSSSLCEQPEHLIDALSLDSSFSDDEKTQRHVDRIVLDSFCSEHELTLSRVEEFDYAEDLELRNVYIRSSLLYTWYL